MEKIFFRNKIYRKRVQPLIFIALKTDELIKMSKEINLMNKYNQGNRFNRRKVLVGLRLGLGAGVGTAIGIRSGYGT
jgi:hypothetical protein